MTKIGRMVGSVLSLHEAHQLPVSQHLGSTLRGLEVFPAVGGTRSTFDERHHANEINISVPPQEMWIFLRKHCPFLVSPRCGWRLFGGSQPPFRALA